MSLWSVRLAQAVGRLRAAGIADPARDARLLLAHAADIAPDRVTLILPEMAEPQAAADFEALIVRRAAREPVSHLTGARLFWGRRFAVTSDVLDPRPETETLIAAALSAPFARVLDLGLGSGCILLTLLAERPDATGQGADLSPAALAIAGQNATALGVADRAQLLQGSWFAPVSGRFDLIVSNPPYIAASEMEGLSPEVRDHEPRMALTDEEDGLSAYRAIAAGVMGHLEPGGRVLLEIGPTQGEQVSGFLRQAGLADVHILHDFDSRDRVVAASAPI